MSKKLIHHYTFNAAAGTVTIEGSTKLERLLLITNVTDNVIIYNFANPALGGTLSYNSATEQSTITLTYNTSSMSNTDKLQIFIQDDVTYFSPSETYADPVSKFRVSQPETLIDTDFEYSLQPTKWETLELVNNIPTYFSRTGSESLSISTIEVTAGSNLVTVTTASEHGLLAGIPIIVQGTRTITCDGTFVVTSVTSSTVFTYRAKRELGTTRQIQDPYTTIFIGALYQGTEFQLESLGGIETDGATPSTLTVTTKSTHGFSQGTSFNLVNSLTSRSLDFDATNVTADNYTDSNQTNVSTTAYTSLDYTGLGVNIYDWQGQGAAQFAFDPNACTLSSNAITTPTAHGFTDNRPYLYVAGPSNTVITGLTNYFVYYVRVLSATQFYLTTTETSTTRVTISNLTPAGYNNYGHHTLLRAIKVNSATGGTTDRWNVDEVPSAAGIVANTQVAYFDNTLTTGGAKQDPAISASLNNHANYTRYYVSSISGNAFGLATVSGGARLTTVTSYTATANRVYFVPLTELASSNTFYKAGHGYTNNSIIELNSSGTPPGGLANGVNYVAQVIDANRFRLKNTAGTLINFTSIGTIGATNTFTSRSPNLSNDTVNITNHDFAANTPLLLNTQGNTAIGGTTNGVTYYVFAQTTNQFKLANISGGWTTAAISCTQNATNINVTTGVVTCASTTGFTQGRQVQYLSATPAIGLTNGGFYFVRPTGATTFTLHWTYAGSIANTEPVAFFGVATGTGTFREADIVDISAAGVGTQTFGLTATIGAGDAVYTIDTIPTPNTFTLPTSSALSARTFAFSPTATVDLRTSAIRSDDNNLARGTAVVYDNGGGTSVGGLTDGTTYYVIRLSKDWIRLATTSINADAGAFITLTTYGTGTNHTLVTNSIVGSIQGSGTVSALAGSLSVSGINTTFNSFFKSGDEFNILYPASYTAKTFELAPSGGDFDTAVLTQFTTAQTIIATNSTGGLTTGIIYYGISTGTAVRIHPTYDDLVANTNKITCTASGAAVNIINNGSSFTGIIDYINGAQGLILTSAPTVAGSGLLYDIKSSLLIRADGFAIHRPYDGGVELTPSTNPDSQMIRQTRKYFRYQSGKGLQVSMAINFSPTVQMNKLQSAGTTTITGFTRFPHRLTAGTNIRVSGAVVDSGTNYYNGDFEIATIIDEYSFTYTAAGVNVTGRAGGFVEYTVLNWQNSYLRGGMYDDCNGIFFEYDGDKLYCVRRNSTQELNGVCNLEFNSTSVVGIDTSFESQLSAGSKIVIKGNMYKVTAVTNDNLIEIIPSYRGATRENAIIQIIQDERTPQEDWNLDPCDGTGPTGYVLNKYRIQMAYIDYSWYGAGKVRYGFKDEYGQVKYVHEYIHNNKRTEAYLRSGNLPARYEIENVGIPSYVPALAHWGTSVIMDGRFDDDKAYTFTASSQTQTQVNADSVTFNGPIFQVAEYYQWSYSGTTPRRGIRLGFGIEVDSGSISSKLNVAAGKAVTAPAGLAANTVTRTAIGNSSLGPYLNNVTVGTAAAVQGSKSLILIDRAPTGTATTQLNTITINAIPTGVNKTFPIVSIRLAPSVDNGIPGLLGEREIVNRMQLILSSIEMLTTHAIDVKLILNGVLNNNTWERNLDPSLSQAVYHDSSNTISGGAILYQFKAEGGTATSATDPRTSRSTVVDLGQAATLGNSILGGNSAYPDGPDVLTVVVTLTADSSTITSNQPWSISSRISWLESQA